MRKIIKLITITMLFLLLFSGCSKNEDNDDSDSKTNNGDSSDIGNNSDLDKETDSNGEVPVDYTFEAEVIETGNTLLIAPNAESNEYRSSDKISVSLIDSKILNIEGKEIAKEDLKAGDIIKITYNGMIAESYPAQISASQIEVVDHNILMEGYLALIDDIYQEDNGLNSEIDMIALDTTEWVDLTEIEKEMIFVKMKELYGFEVIEGTFEELAEEVLIYDENLLFPKGIHLTISNMKYDDKKQKITCSIKKWRSGLGAIGSDATAKYDKTEWKITKENMWIS